MAAIFISLIKAVS